MTVTILKISTKTKKSISKANLGVTAYLSGFILNEFA